jgi:hypothetical protein
MVNRLVLDTPSFRSTVISGRTGHGGFGRVMPDLSRRF